MLGECQRHQDSKGLALGRQNRPARRSSGTLRLGLGLHQAGDGGRVDPKELGRLGHAVAPRLYPVHQLGALHG